MSRYSLDPAAPAFGPRGPAPAGPAAPSSLYCKRQHSGDGPRTGPLSPGGPPAPGLRPPGCSPKRNGTSLEGNRCGNVMHAWTPTPLLPLPPGPVRTTADGGGEDHSYLNVGTLGNLKFP